MFETAKYTCSSLAEEEEECDSNGGAWNFNTNTCDGSGGCVDYVCVPRTCTGGRVFDSCSCQCVSGSPILIDTLGDGFALTDAAAGADFDLNGDGTPERLSWTRAASDDMWLALDRNGDGLIDSGRELFGNFTSQPDPPPGQEKQGFLALAEFDKAAAGGNSDGEINRQDTIFDSLRLWQDSNHDGVSQAHELKSLKGLGLKSIDLYYKKSKRVDEHGNEFRYRAKVKDKNDARLGRWAWDVFLVSGQ